MRKPYSFYLEVEPYRRFRGLLVAKGISASEFIRYIIRRTVEEGDVDWLNGEEGVRDEAVS